MSADAKYHAGMRFSRTLIPAGPRLYWRAVVKSGPFAANTRISWHAASCAAPLNDCVECQP